jgi:hypothetical protein
MAKTLRKLMLEELGLEDTPENHDKAESAVDLVFDWLDRIERNGRVSMASGWRAVAEDTRKYENDTNSGR